MAKPWEQYTKEMFERFGYMATWTPGVQLELGDVGVVKDRLFTRITSLKNLGIDFNIREDVTEEEQKFASSSNVSILFKAAGTAPAVGSVLTQAQAGFSIEFKKSKATVYEAVGCVAPMIDDQVAVGKRILELNQHGDWNKDWAVVTELVKAKSATVLISNSSSAKIELSASGTVTGVPNLGSVSAQFQLAFSKDMMTSLISQHGLTPLFKARAIKSNGPIGPLETANVIGANRSALDFRTLNQAISSEDLFFGNVDVDLTGEEDVE
ncbi:MAG TPA: hypothetical protein VI306_02410 [Pyrinomonadaceae bacterium]